MPLEVRVVSQVRELYHTYNADIVIVPGSQGEMGVLPRHTPLLTTLRDQGELQIIEGDTVHGFVVFGGVVDIRPDKVIVLADDAKAAAEIDYEAARAARERARRLMESSPAGERTQVMRELRRAEIEARIAQRVMDRPRYQIQVREDEDEIG
ncbi:MAG: ATP synthase F1 subunit epsilon [Anaerolineae bacterium]|jgi:F-type H+-transporting ATPase subunit epsilon|nr:ATP synthase F1 subunit epsilon [Anaerolineae bacterium]